MDRRWRLVFVLLLCVLLPLRGALAASMACAGLTLPTPARTAPPPELHAGCPHGHTGMRATTVADGAAVDRLPSGPDALAIETPPAADAHAHAHTGPIDTARNATQDTTPDAGLQHPSCHLCVAGCLWLPLPAAAADWRPEPAARGAHFPPPALPPIAWVADGPDRPPKG